MKAEDRKQLERNELAARLNTAWHGLSSNSTTVTLVWGLILVGLVALIGYRYYSRATADTRSELWSQLDRASDVEDLERLVRDHKNTEAARVAQYHLSRYQLQDALSRIANPNNVDDRVKAADELEKARDRYAELAKEGGAEPVLLQEALMGVAKAEEVLAGVPTAVNATKMRGSLDQAIAAYDALAKKYPRAFLGEKAAQRAKEIGEHRSRIEALYAALSKVQGKPEPAPIPPLGPSLPVPLLPGQEVPKPEAPKLPDAPKAEEPKPLTAPKPDDPMTGEGPKAGDPKR